MWPASDRVKLTYADLLALPDDGMRHELIDGEHHVTPAPRPAHQIVAGNLHLLIGTYLREQPHGVLMFAPLDVVLSPHDVVEPDLVSFSRVRFSTHVGERCAEGPPDLAVEIVSRGTRRRDEMLKRRLYERMQVGEYWVVDPRVESVTVYRLSGTTYQRPQHLARQDDAILRTPLFPELELPLARIFELPEGLPRGG